MKRQLLTTAAAAALLYAASATAQAQNPMTHPTAAQTPATAAQSPTTTPTADAGIRMAKSASFAVRFASPKPADVMTSKLVAITVYNNQNEKLGEIEDLAIENGKTVSGLVVSVGGFLGMGERYVLIDPASLVINESDGTWKAFVDTTKDKLKNAPQFTYTRAKS